MRPPWIPELDDDNDKEYFDEYTSSDNTYDNITREQNLLFSDF